jgi:phosphoserine phosphatase RsbU/P
VVADAAGHGMAAGLLMAITDSSLRIALEHDPSPAGVAALLHRVIRRTGDRRAFLTIVYGRLDPARGDLELVGGGHPSPIARRADGTLAEPLAGSLPLGLRDRHEPAFAELTLAPGELVVLFSDGLVEAVNPGGEAFGWDRLRACVRDGGAAPELCRRILAAFDAHLAGEPLADDLTLVVVERLALP